MGKEVGFARQEKKASANKSSAKEIGVGLFGYGFIKKTHTNALKKIPYIYWLPVIPKLVSVCGSREEGVREAAARYGYDHYTTDWKELVTDPQVDVFDNVGPNNLHAEPCIAAAKAGKHVICEKTLARSAEEAKRMWGAVKAASVKPCADSAIALFRQFAWRKRCLTPVSWGEIDHFRVSYQE